MDQPGQRIPGTYSPISPSRNFLVEFGNVRLPGATDTKNRVENFIQDSSSYSKREKYVYTIENYRSRWKIKIVI